MYLPTSRGARVLLSVALAGVFVAGATGTYWLNTKHPAQNELQLSVNAPHLQFPARQVTMYSDPHCGCCGSWAEHLTAHGYDVTIEHVDNINELKDQYGIPHAMRSCHTAFVDGLVIEGHVPITAIERFLTNPLPFGEHTVGLSVPGMPLGSPGMEVGRYQDFDAVAFSQQGEVKTVAEYRF